MSEPAPIEDLMVRDATAADENSVAVLVTAAFNQDTEARLVKKLRHCGALVLEQVIVDPAGKILGHVAYSRVTSASIGPGHGLEVVCLAPVSVWPDRQRQGLGSKLIKASLERLKEMGEDLVLVLGPPSYYPRFGFDPVLAQKVKGPYAGDPFMALALTDAGRNNLPIEVAFATPFQEFD